MRKLLRSMKGGRGDLALSETKKRIIGALYFGIPFLVFLYLGKYYFLVFLLLLSTISLFELLDISGIKNFLYFPSLLIPFFIRKEVAISFILLYVFIVFLIERKDKNDMEKHILYPFIFITITSIPLSFFYMIREEKGFLISLIILLSIWIDDISAYFLGKKFGKRRIVPNISPGKSYEGLVGSFIVVSIFLFISSLLFNLFPLYKSFVFALVIVILSFLGDIFESLIKRRFNVKDSGKIIMGHGGIMDRIDSLIFTIPVLFYLL